jgi:glutamyl-tRNA synthetase
MASTGPVRTRYAPSPTGFLHVGGVRTLLYSWLLARHFGGQFLLRIEDTDRTRLVPDSVNGLLEDIEWLGLDIDEGPSAEDLVAAGYPQPPRPPRSGGVPLIQSLRVPRYREVAEHLVAAGRAYRCDCDAQRLEAERAAQTSQGLPTGYSGRCRTRNVPATVPHVIRFRIPEDASVGFTDAVRGPISWSPVVLRDTVILKTDGFPTYHLAALVDDHDTGITHVLRGEEWISTTPLHLLIYQALGWEVPVMAHLSVVLGTDGKKLSKRHGATHCRTFRESGYLPDALLNFLLLNGWSPGDDTEFFTRAEMIERFSLERVHGSPAVFSYDKLAWMNGMYLRRTPDDQLAALIEPLLRQAGMTVRMRALVAIVPHIRERLQTTLLDAVPLVEFLFREPQFSDAEAFTGVGLSADDIVKVLDGVARRWASGPFEPPALEQALREVIDELGSSKKSVMMTVRLAATGRKVTPPLFESISVLGRERTLARMADARRAVAATSSAAPASTPPA